MDSELASFLAEQFGEINRRFDDVHRQFDTVNQRFDTVNQRFDTVDQRFDAVDQRLDAVDQRLDTVDQRLEIMDRKIDEKFEEAKRHFGVLAERLESKVELLAEGFRGFDRQFQEHCQQSESAHGEIISLVRLTYRDLRRRVR